ncbi:MAG TPA: hypothetical protein PKH24_12850 [Sedimentisphaerales bacterium]|jgi:hypothetical protein|nr:hypothetical protein [Sedimentisphaerales bacterium]HNU29645.1 hypothetical protein [Sedimentisphaerales bacterium]
MIAKALFFLLVVLSVAFLLSSLRRREGVFEFPTLFAGAFLFSIVPQLINHVFYPGRLPAKVYEDHGVEYGLIMCILCLVAGIASYRGTPRVRRETTLWRIDVDRLFRAGVALYLVGTFGALKLAALSGGLREQFTEGGHYALEWSGAPVIWSYVSKLLPFGLLLCLNSVLIRGSLWKWTVVVLMTLYPLAVIVFLGRRAMVFRLALIVFISVWFQRRWTPPRWLCLTGMALGGMCIILAPSYRTYANQTGDIRGALRQADMQSAVEKYAMGERGEGIENLIIGIPARLSYLSFSWGSGFWNGMIAYWVPGQIVGYRLKQGLMLRIGAGDDEVFWKYCGLGFAPGGAFSTGPYSAFREFGFFGCLLFFMMGRFYRWLWHLAAKRRSLGAQVFYVSFALAVPMAVVTSVLLAFDLLLLSVVAVVPALWLIRERQPTLVPCPPVSDPYMRWPQSLRRCTRPSPFH